MVEYETIKILLRYRRYPLRSFLRKNDIRDARTPAASIFSLMPPTGITFPRRVISPAIARRGAYAAGGECRHDSRGHCDYLPTVLVIRYGALRHMEVKLIRVARGRLHSTFPRVKWAFTHTCMAIAADSFITLPRLPVSVSFSPFDR